MKDLSIQVLRNTGQPMQKPIQGFKRRDRVLVAVPKREVKIEVLSDGRA